MNLAQRHHVVFLWLTGTVVLYVLSVGPAVRFSLGSGWSDVVDVVWYPVIALDGTVAQPVYRAYLELWVVHMLEPIGF